MRKNLHAVCMTALMVAASFIAPAASTTFPNDPSIPFSKYGQIQNVQNYSSNPFWNPNAPYNQRMPQPVYVQGADLSASDCQTVVAALVQSYCNMRNNCINDSLDDIRPTLTVQLAALPNHNYVGSCIGYLDTEFEKYRTAHSAAIPTGTVAFPGATAPNAAAAGSEFKIENPLRPVDATWNGDDWEHQMNLRKQELKDLQAQNGAGNEHLEEYDFPTTIADLTYAQRRKNATTGYMPYQDKSAYEQLDVDNIEETTFADDNASATAQSRHQTLCMSKKKELESILHDIITLKKCQSDDTDFRVCLNDLSPDTLVDPLPPTGTPGSNDATYEAPPVIESEHTPWYETVFLTGAIAGWTLFSESDCLIDPETGRKTCCNTFFEGAVDAKKVPVGGFMFCGSNDATPTSLPGAVRQCMQNKKNPSTKADPIFGIFKNDYWSQDCQVRICDGVPPRAGMDAYIEWVPRSENVCWDWYCIDAYEKQGSDCVPRVASLPKIPKNASETYDFWIDKLVRAANDIITDCPELQEFWQTELTKNFGAPVQ